MAGSIGVLPTHVMKNIVGMGGNPNVLNRVSTYGRQVGMEMKSDQIERFYEDILVLDPEPIFEKYALIDELLLYTYMIYDDRFGVWIQRNDPKIFGKLCKLVHRHISNITGDADDFTKDLVKMFALSRIPYCAADDGENRVIAMITELLLKNPSLSYYPIYKQKLGTLSLYSTRYRYNFPDREMTERQIEELVLNLTNLVFKLDIDRDLSKENKTKLSSDNIESSRILPIFLAKIFYSKELTVEDAIEFFARFDPLLLITDMLMHFNISNQIAEYTGGLNRGAFDDLIFTKRVFDMFKGCTKNERFNSIHPSFLGVVLSLSTNISMEEFNDVLNDYKKLLPTMPNLYKIFGGSLGMVRRKEWTHIILQKLTSGGYLNQVIINRTKKELLYLPGPYSMMLATPKSTLIDSLSATDLTAFLKASGTWEANKKSEYIQMGIDLAIKFGIHEALPVIYSLLDVGHRDTFRHQVFMFDTKLSLDEYNRFVVKWYQTFGFPSNITMSNVRTSFHISYFLMNRPSLTIGYDDKSRIISPSIIYVLKLNGWLRNIYTGILSVVAGMLETH
jgi:hypothetical protein